MPQLLGHRLGEGVALTGDRTHGMKVIQSAGVGALSQSNKWNTRPRCTPWEETQANQETADHSFQALEIYKQRSSATTPYLSGRLRQDRPSRVLAPWQIAGGLQTPHKFAAKAHEMGVMLLKAGIITGPLSRKKQVLQHNSRRRQPCAWRQE
jgi:hypothetical protein